MARPRLMLVLVSTPRRVRGLDVEDLHRLPIQKQLHLDAPHQVVIKKVMAFSTLPEPPTTVLFQYSNGFADGAAFNEGVADVEGGFIEMVKVAFGVETVYFATEKIDFKQG
jgi:hypothetical protein